jgi:RHS repeat-associated protein
VGNRLSENSTVPGISSGTFTFNSDDEMASETYDSNGNALTMSGKVFTYDSENHLKSMNGGAVALVYDGDGHRVAKTVNGVTTRYLVDDLNPTGYAQVVEEVAGGAVQREYAYGLQRISQSQFISNTWTTSYYSYDGLGSVRQLTNAAGAVTDSYEYDAFGNSFTVSGTTPNNYIYRGEQYDSDLGLYYLRARYYNPVTGRFLSRDPYEGEPQIPATLHKYLYVGGNPVMFYDPTGFEAAEEDAVKISLTPGLLNLGEDVVIKGELTVASDGTATVVIDYIEGNVASPLRFLQTLISLAQDNGGKVLTVLATIANPKLLNIAVNRFGFIDSAGQAVWYGVIGK